MAAKKKIVLGEYIQQKSKQPTMNSPFLIRPPLSNQASESGSGRGITRRAFIKRTGGATVGAMVVWNLASTRAAAALVIDYSTGSISVVGHCPPHLPKDGAVQILYMPSGGNPGMAKVTVQCIKCGATWFREDVLPPLSNIN